MANFSVYPEQLDGYFSLPLVRNQIDEIRAEVPNRLRDAIIKIEQELGVQPSGTFATVRARLDEIGDVRALHLAHLADPEDAHDASAISVEDTDDHYFEEDVEGVLSELGSLVPPRPDQIGFDNSKVPNDGIPDWYDGYGRLHVFNVTTGNSENVMRKTQPRNAGIRGIQIIDVSSNTDPGTGAFLKLGGGVGTETLTWRAPGESDGVPVPISGLDTGEIEVLSSGGDTSKKIRIARTSEPLRVPPKEEEFEVYRMDAVPGFFSLPSAGFKETKFVTRTAIDKSGTSRLQAMVSGTVFPADRGTLVLQRKLRGAAEFFPIAVLNLKNIFNENIRSAGQVVYTPTLENFDSILLYDRRPVKEDYSSNLDASQNSIFDDYENDFNRLQVAKYLIPLSNPDIVGGTLTSPEGIAETDANDDISAYRIVHYKTEETTADFSGEPASTEVFSNLETSVPDFNENPQNFTRITNFYVDSSPTRPGIEHVNLAPVKTDINDGHNPINTANIAFLSGIPYYANSTDEDNKFEIELRTDNNVFNKTYLREEILRFSTNVFNFPHGTASGVFGAQVDVSELLDDGYVKFSASNLPNHNDQAFYFAKDAGDVAVGIPSIDTRLYPAPNVFSTRAYIRATMYDPFGPGDGYDAYGVDFVNRILVNGYDTSRSTDSTEWFTDETFRVVDTHEFLGPTDGYTATAVTSSASIASTPSLQCGGRFVADESHIPGLIYPQDDYTVGNGVVPNNSSTTRDYSVLTGDRTYRRTFSLGYAISGGKLRIKSDGNSLISFEDIRYKQSNERDRFGKIEVKIPGFDSNSTGWLDIGRLFRTGHYKDGDGALAGAVTGGPGNFVVPFTFGPRNNANTENKIAVKVTYFGQHEEEREVSKQKIMTLLQLLP